MKSTVALSSLAVALLTAASLRAADNPAVPTTNPPAADTSPFKDQRDKVSYAIGVNIGNTMKRNLYDVNIDQVATAIRDTIADKPILLSPQQMGEAITFYQQEARRLHEQRDKQWLVENKKKEGVQAKEVNLLDGTKAELQYKVIKEGDGAIPTSTDMVTVNYRGTLVDGTEFDSSFKRGQPATFGVTGVIRGWTEALTMMRTGSKWELYLPAELAYGQRGSQAIQPGSTLIFEVELLKTEPPKPPEPPPTAALPRPAATSDIIKVPSAEELAKGAKIETIKAEDAERMAREAAQAAARTNSPDKK